LANNIELAKPVQPLSFVAVGGELGVMVVA
jgi:hypothetical protein